MYNAFTGGRDTLKEQKEKGGIVEKCVINSYLSIFFETEAQTKKRVDLCRTGKRPCGSCKPELTENIVKFLEKHKKKREKVKINKFLRN